MSTTSEFAQLMEWETSAPVDAPAHARRRPPAKRPSSAVELAAELKRQFAPSGRMHRWIIARPRLTLTALALFVFVVAGYNRAVTPPYGEREYQAGKAAYRAGRYDEAEQHFEQALSREPDNLRARRARGWARLKASKTLPHFKALDKMDQAFNDLMYGRGENIDDSIVEVNAYLQARHGNPRQVLVLLGELVKSGPLSAAHLNNRAFCCLQLAGGPDRAMMLSQAEADLEAAAALTPNCQAVYYNRAMIVHQKGGASQQSLNDIERAVQLGPASHALYRDAALMYGRAADLRRTPVMLDAPIATALFLEARSRRIERALYYARESIALGQYPRQFILFKNLVPPATLSELVGMKQLITPSTQLRLIDPAGELD